MMTKKELLENGLLEQYVLGELDSKQVEVIEQLLLSDTEIKEQLDKIESDFESLGMENAIHPPNYVKTQLLSKIEASNNKTVSNSGNNNKFWLGIAASFAAFFLLGSIWLYSELNTVKEDLQIVSEQNKALKEDLNGISKAVSYTHLTLPTTPYV